MGDLIQNYTDKRG